MLLATSHVQCMCRLINGFVIMGRAVAVFFHLSSVRCSAHQSTVAPLAPHLKERTAPGLSRRVLLLGSLGLRWKDLWIYIFDVGKTLKTPRQSGTGQAQSMKLQFECEWVKENCYLLMDRASPARPCSVEPVSQGLAG